MPGGTPGEPEDRRRRWRSRRRCSPQKTRGLYPAPAGGRSAAMVEGALVDYDTATRIESALARAS